MPAEPLLSASEEFKQFAPSQAIPRSVRRSMWKSIIIELFQQLKGGQLLLIDKDESLHLGTPGPLHAQIILRDKDIYRRLALGGTMAFAETYMEGMWESPDLFSLFRLFAQQRELISAMDGARTRWMMPLLKFGEWLRANTLKGSQKNISAHYDLGNDLFKLFLDPTLTYSSAYWEQPHLSLEDASLAKLDRMCRMVELKASDHLVEIGSGWGSFAHHAASKYGCRVTTITLSAEQKKLADERIKTSGLEGRVKVLLQDYRTLEGQYDKLVSIEMIEAVGHKYLGQYFKRCGELVKPGGLLALQAITLPDHAYAAHLKGVDFIQKYIFPGSKIPCVSVLCEQARKNSQMVLTDLKDLTLDYSKTMQMWRKNFVGKLDEVKKLGYDDRFIRMWDYYLNYCAAGFADRYLNTVQMQFRKL